MEDVHACPTCGRDFEASRGMRIHHALIHGKALPNCTCARCGTEFHSEHERKYCSNPCREAATSFAGSANPNYSGAKEQTECEHCGERFEFYPSEKIGRFCRECTESTQWRSTPALEGSANPRWNGGKRLVPCTVCGDGVERWPSEIASATLCSESCRREWLSESFSGSGHPNWRGGTNRSYGQGWAHIREAALERDTCRCKVCGRTHEELGRNPDIHHITPVREFVESDLHSLEDAHTLDNVIALCSSCHRKAEFGTISRSTLRGLIADE